MVWGFMVASAKDRSPAQAGSAALYQDCRVPQCGQATVVLTGARKAKLQAQW